MSTTDDPTMIPLPAGPKHEVVLDALHRILRPKSYLEIGIDRGATFGLARCPSIGIDPDFLVDPRAIVNKPECLFYRMPSDAFFERHDPSALLGRKIDLAFIDGMHQFEFTLRDFMNVERFCHRRSLVLLHDCVPADLYLARRDRADESLRGMTQLQGGWCGDVWKVLPLLRKYRPDLRIEAFDSAWTGLIVISNLNPDSRILTGAYSEAVAEYMSIDMRDYGVRRHTDEQKMQDARILLDPVLMPKHYGF